MASTISLCASQTIERINSFSFGRRAVLTAGRRVGTGGKSIHYIMGDLTFDQSGLTGISTFSERVNGYFFFLYFKHSLLQSHFLQ